MAKYLPKVTQRICTWTSTWLFLSTKSRLLHHYYIPLPGPTGSGPFPSGAHPQNLFMLFRLNPPWALSAECPSVSSALPFVFFSH